MDSLERAKTCWSNLYIRTSVKTNSPAHEPENSIQNKKQEKNKRGVVTCCTNLPEQPSLQCGTLGQCFSTSGTHQEW